MARTAKLDIEKRFYDVFSGWSKVDQAVALRVLSELHERLPEKARKPEPQQVELPGAKV